MNEKEFKIILDDYTNLIKKFKKPLTISDIKVGEQFVYGGRNYTKLNEECFVIIDDFDNDFMNCIFDPITNNYDESFIRYYINSDRFIERLGIDKKDIITHYLNDYITLLSIEDFENYEEFIRDYKSWYWTRSASNILTNGVCNIYNSGYIGNANVNDVGRVRVGFILNPDTPIAPY